MIAEPRGLMVSDVRPVLRRGDRPVRPMTFTDSIADQFVEATVEELRKRQAAGAASAVIRSVSNRLGGRESRAWRRRRTLALADHALRVWARRALQHVDEDVYVGGLDSLGPIVDEQDAAYAAEVLGGYMSQLREPAPPWFDDVGPALKDIRAALVVAGSMALDDLGVPDDSAERCAQACGRAVARLFLDGVISALPPEVAAVARQLDALDTTHAD